MHRAVDPLSELLLVSYRHLNELLASLGFCGAWVQVSSLSGSIKAAAAQRAQQEAAAHYQGQLSDLEVALSAAHGQHSSLLRDVGSALADFGLQPELAAARRELELVQEVGRQHLEQGLGAVRAARQEILQVRSTVFDTTWQCSVAVQLVRGQAAPAAEPWKQSGLPGPGACWGERLLLGQQDR